MRPEKVFRVGPCAASVFLNQYGYSVNLHRRYREAGEGEWKSTSYFRFSDLPQAAMALTLATDYVAAREAAREPAETASEPPAEEA